jgi:hypothetical protein
VATAVAVVCGVAAAASGAGCGGSAAGTVATDDPAAAFAPLVLLDPGERQLPVGARWFVDRSVLRFAEDQGCGDLKIAVGRRLAAQHTAIHDWIYVDDIGTSPVYWRNASDARCEPIYGRKFFANQLTRPHHPRGRPAGLRPGEGFYLDLVDSARGGGAADALDRVPAYVQRRTTEVDGEPGTLLTYWLLFGMSEPAPSEGTPAREGDWERVEVALRGSEGEYEPVSVRLVDGDGHPAHSLPWAGLPRRASKEGTAATHPVVIAARGDHSLSAASRPCADCLRWRTWRSLEPATGQLWYGFGGAWGEPGPTDATTGPLGPMPASRR